MFFKTLFCQPGNNPNTTTNAGKLAKPKANKSSSVEKVRGSTTCLLSKK